MCALATDLGAPKQIKLCQVNGRKVDVDHSNLFTVVSNGRASHGHQKHVYCVHVLVAHTTRHAGGVYVAKLRRHTTTPIGSHDMCATRANNVHPCNELLKEGCHIICQELAEQ